jgi:hypothetical protein
MYFLINTDGVYICLIFLIRILYLVGCMFSCSISKPEKFQTNLFDLFRVSIILLLSIYPFFIGLHWLIGIFLALIFIIYQPSIDAILNKKFPKQDFIIQVYSNTLYWLVFIIIFAVLFFFTLSPIWIVAATVWLIGSIINGVFELTRKSAILELDKDVKVDKRLFCSPYGSRYEYPTLVVWLSFFIFYPFSIGIVELSVIRLVYSSLLVASFAVLGFLATSIINASKGIMKVNSKKILGNLANGYSFLLIILSIISLIGILTIKVPLDFSTYFLVPPMPMDERSMLPLSNIFDIAIFTSLISLVIGIVCSLPSLLSLVIRMHE